jgi:hypothetical protein
VSSLPQLQEWNPKAHSEAPNGLRDIQLDQRTGEEACHFDLEKRRVDAAREVFRRREELVASDASRASIFRTSLIRLAVGSF